MINLSTWPMEDVGFTNEQGGRQCPVEFRECVGSQLERQKTVPL